jgi:hypothetical protein
MMRPREKLQLCYELAFFPPRLNELWNEIRSGEIKNLKETAELLDTALLLHSGHCSAWPATRRRPEPSA